MKSGTDICAIFGANSVEGVSVIQSLADVFQIPYIFSVHEAPMYVNSTSVNIFPQMKTLTMVSIIGILNNFINTI